MQRKTHVIRLGTKYWEWERGEKSLYAIKVVTIFNIKEQTKDSLSVQETKYKLSCLCIQIKNQQLNISSMEPSIVFF